MLKGLSFVCLSFLLFSLPLEAIEHDDEEQIRTSRQLQDDTADGAAVITVVFQTDQAPEEISWILFDSNTGVLINLVEQGSYSGPNATESVTLSVTEGHSYTLQVMDSAKNGICCSNGEGTVTVYLGAQASGDSILALSDGIFGSQLFLSFEASSGATLFFEPSTAPSLPPTDTSNPSSRPSMVPSVSPGPTITAAPSMDVVTVVITVAILTDQFPEEISWRLVGVTDTAVLREVPQGTYVTPFVRELTTVVVTGNERYSLVVEDLADDGICCFYGEGEVRVFLGFPDASPLAYSGGDYSSGVTLEFLASTSGIISVPPPAPTPAPAAPSTPPAATCQGRSPPEDGCAICGPGMCVGNLDAIFTFPGQPPVPCGLVELLGLIGGSIPPDDCLLIPPLASGVCGCQPAAPSQPSFRPPAAPSAPSASMGPCPFVPFGGCSICGSGRCVGNPNGIFAFPGQPTYFCDEFERLGASGGIPLDQCPFVPPLVDNDCGCRFSETAPSAGAPITFAPIFFGSPVSPPVFAPTSSCPAVPSGGCSVCGPGTCVGNPDAIFAFPGQPVFVCGELQESGYAGLIPFDQCPFLPGLLFDVCECRFGETPPPPPPVASPPTSCPPVPSNGCSICGPDQCVGNPDAIFIFPGQPVATCAQVEEAGLVGNIPLDQCAFLPSFVNNLCECRPASTFCPAVGAGCEVCGPGKCVGDPNAIFSFPGQPTVACGQLEQQGIDGFIPFESCGFLPPLIEIVCNCISGETPPPAPQPITSCPAVSSAGCAVCGSDRCVGIPDAVFEFPGQPSVTCGQLEEGGLSGLIPLEICPAVPPLIDTICGCISGETPPPTTACPAEPSRGCAVCGPGMCVGNPDGIFEFPGRPDVTCGVLQDAGFNGQIPLDQCPFLPPFIGTVCDCRSGETLPSVSPFAAPPGNASPLVLVGLDACKSSPCGICEGDCDSDFECGPGLKCFNRRTFSDPLPPGCFDSGSFFVDDFDFCYDDSAPPVIPPTFGPNLPPVFFAPVVAPSLPPFTVSPATPVAQAAPTSSLPLVFLGLGGCSESNQCGPCEGDCDSDDDCGPGLQCFTRTGSFDPLPEGCFDSGTFGIADYDFCYGEPTLAGGSCPPILPAGCSLCGEGKCVGNPSGELEIEGQPVLLRCDDLERLGASGFIPSDECLLMSTIVNEKCGCRPGEPSVTGAPATPAPVTVAPETDVPQTDVPQTDVPQTVVPQTGVPQTDVPQTDAPQTEPPVAASPVTEVPQTEAPVAPAPATEAPATEVPEISTD